MDTKIEIEDSETYIIATKPYLSETKNPRLACIRKGKTVEFYDLVIFGEEGKPLHQKTLNVGDLQFTSFLHAPKAKTLLLGLHYPGCMELMSVQKEAPFDIKSLAVIGASENKQARSNEWWTAILGNHNGSLNLFWVNNTCPKTCFEACVSMNNKTSHIAVLGDSKQNTRCYMIERYAGFFHVTWSTPAGNEAKEREKMILSSLNAVTDIILFMDTYQNRILILAQDKKLREGEATLQLIILEHVSIDKPPVMVGKTTIQDYHAPLGVSICENFLLLAHNGNLGWVDVSPAGDRDDAISYIQTGQKKVTRFGLVKDRNGKIFVSAWVPCIEDGTMHAVIYDEKANEIANFKTDFCVSLNEEGVLETPKIFAIGNTAFGSLIRENDNYVKCFQLVL